MPERFDFSFWPPRPIERSPITPAQTAPDEEICFDLALIPDNTRRAAVHATGDWADIQDFWVEAIKGPTAKEIEAQTILDPLSSEPHSGFKLLNRRYLNTPYLAFRQVVQEVARLDGEMQEDSPFFRILSNETQGGIDLDTAAELFISDFVFNKRDTRFFPHQLLIARRALTTMYDDITKEDIDPWPVNTSNDGKVIIAKVALRWHENFLENSLK